MDVFREASHEKGDLVGFTASLLNSPMQNRVRDS